MLMTTRGEAEAQLASFKARFTEILRNFEVTAAERLIAAGCDPTLTRGALACEVDEILANAERELALPEDAAERADA